MFELILQGIFYTFMAGIAIWITIVVLKNIFKLLWYIFKTAGYENKSKELLFNIFMAIPFLTLIVASIICVLSMLLSSVIIKEHTLTYFKVNTRREMIIKIIDSIV